MIQFRTNFTPAINLDGRSKGAAGGLLEMVRPTLVGDVPVLGQVKYAPYGEADERSGALVIGVLAVLVVIGFLAVLKLVFRR